MRRLRPIAVTALACLAVALAAGPALAESPVLTDCSSHNRLTGHYTVAQLKSALATMPADIKEYSDCYPVIQQQLFTQLGGHRAAGGHRSAPPGGLGGGSGGFPTALVVIVGVIVLGGAGLTASAWRRRDAASRLGG